MNLPKVNIDETENIEKEYVEEKNNDSISPNDVFEEKETKKK